MDSADNSQVLSFRFRIARKRMRALVFNCSYTSSVLNKIRNPLTICGICLHLRNPLTFAVPALFCGSQLQLRNQQLVIFACCGIRDTTNVPTKFTLPSYVRGIHGSFVSGIHLHFGTCLKISFWNPETNRQKIVRLSSAQLGLLMKNQFILTFFVFI